jgi:hypothetical protein
MTRAEPIAAGLPFTDIRVTNATPRIGRFVVLAVQLGLLQLVFHITYTLGDTDFSRVSAMAFGAFLIHYWLPFRFKEPFWIAVSMAGAFVFLDRRVAELLMGVGALFFAILRCPFGFKWRLLAIAAIFGLFAYGCAGNTLPHIPSGFYAVFGAIFMFRMMVYAHDLSHSREPARLIPFLSYFYLLPNYIFTLFPVIDFQTMRRRYYQRDAHDIIQQGIHWMIRGTIHLMLYKLVVYANDSYLPDRVTSLGALVCTMILTFLLYLNVTGKFHLIVGMLHLFGYDLPETNRRFLLASSVTDFWRRANVYWKDFMVKTVYYPAYFKLRKKGDLRAQLWASALVFVVTWALHAYQTFWIRGRLSFSWTDTIFWTVLGLLVVANLAYENRHKHKKAPDFSWRARGILAAQTLATFSLITFLWTMWSSPTLTSWGYLMTHWMRSGQ